MSRSSRPLAQYPNLPQSLGMIISRSLASFHELDSIYSYDDVLDMIEIIQVNDYNNWVAAEEMKDSLRRSGGRGIR